MVFETAMGFLKLEEKPFNAFFFGMAAAIPGIAIAYTIFPVNAGIVAVFFTSLAMMPFIKKMTEKAAMTGSTEKTVKSHGIRLREYRVRGEKLTLKAVWSEYGKLIKVYFFSFFGIFMVFSTLTLVYPEDVTVKLFPEQKNSIQGSATGKAAAMGAKEAFFIAIIENNLWVMFVCFLIALVYGFGATFIITWNASVWGIAFASRAVEMGSALGAEPFTYFALIMLVVLPHTAAEAMAYFFAAISGSIASIAIAKEKILGTRFKQVVFQAIIVFFGSVFFLFLGAYLEVYVIGFFQWIFWG